MADEQDHVPKWHAEFAERSARQHAEFVERNAREHGELAAEIVRSEVRLTRWTAALVFASAATVIAAISAVILLT